MPRKRPETKRSKIVKLSKGLFLRNGQIFIHKKNVSTLTRMSGFRLIHKIIYRPTQFISGFVDAL